MNDDPTQRPQRVAFRPERIQLLLDSRALDWVVNDVLIGNISQIDRRWYVRLWRRFTWRWDALLVKLRLRKPPKKQLIHVDERCMAVACHQIGAEGPKNTAAWFVECRCGWAHFAMTHAHAIALYANHGPLRDSGASREAASWRDSAASREAPSREPSREP